MTASIIEFEAFSYKYPNSADWTLRDLTFQVDQGEFLGIVGPTGAGKTTLSMCMRGLVPHNFGGTVSGAFHVCGKPMITTTPDKLAGRVGIVFQNPETQVVGLTVQEDLAFGAENLALPPEEIRRRIDEIAEIVQIGHLLDRETWALSGGQKQRLAIGGALVMQPDVLILDEPTAELDPQSKQKIFQIVRDLQRQKDLTIIMIEHEVDDLAEVADRIMALHAGEIKALGSPEQVFRDVGLFKEIQERVPFVIELQSELIKSGLMPEAAFTVHEDEALRYLSSALPVRRRDDR